MIFFLAKALDSPNSLHCTKFALLVKKKLHSVRFVICKTMRIYHSDGLRRSLHYKAAQNLRKRKK